MGYNFHENLNTSLIQCVTIFVHGIRDAYNDIQKIVNISLT